MTDMLFRIISWLFRPKKTKHKKQKEPTLPFVRVSIWAQVYNIGTREHPIHSHYSPTWDIGDSIPEETPLQYSARILFDDINWNRGERLNFCLQANEHHFAILAPLTPYYWQHLMPGDIIKGYEGKKQTCYAVVEQVIIDGNYKVAGI